MYTRRKTINIIAVLMSVLSCLAQAEEPVYFADENLKTCVESHLGIADPTLADMLALDRLDARRQRIVDLGGLEYATNLIHLWLDNNQIIDISAVAGLTNLISLGLRNNQVTDVAPVWALTNLTGLNLSNNPIDPNSNISEELWALPNMQYLWLEGFGIHDISAVSGMPNLIGLWLGNNQISDISAVSGLTDMTHLGLNNNQIIEALVHESNIKYNALSDN